MLKLGLISFVDINIDHLFGVQLLSFRQKQLSISLRFFNYVSFILCQNRKLKLYVALWQSKRHALNNYNQKLSKSYEKPNLDLA